MRSTRPHRGHGPAFVLFAFLLFALLLSALYVHAARAEPAASDWHLYTGQAVIDTIDGEPAAVFGAGAWVLAHDSWEIERKDAGTGVLVTAWKPVRHKLVQLATGPARVRVAVAIKSVGRGRCEVRVLGGIAARDELGGAVLPLAQRAGQHECQGYVDELKARLAEDRLSDGAPSNSPRGTAEKR